MAGKAVDASLAGTSFKAYCSKVKMGTVDYLLASETLKFKNIIIDILDKAAVSTKQLDINSLGVLMVMVYEILFGKGVIRGGGSVKRKVLDVVESLKLVLKNEMVLKMAKDPRDLLPAQVLLADSTLRQYLRINVIKVAAHQQVVEAIKSKCPDAEVDSHIPYLYALPVKAPSFGEHQLVKDGKLIIQDKASCFPSQLLIDEWKGGDVIDACAAPGNKTTHIAALMWEIQSQSRASVGNPKIFAFEKDFRRARILSERTVLAGAADKITVKNLDFLNIHPADYNFATAILLDPSCSGSGVMRSLERLGDIQDANEKRDMHRINTLRDFQVKALRKTFQFSNVDTIVYSTCSIHVEENESVVAELLNDPELSIIERGWDLKAPARLQGWHRRGLQFPGLSQKQSDCLIRCNIEDGMIGFFVAVFKKNPNPNPVKKNPNPVRIGSDELIDSPSDKAHMLASSNQGLKRSNTSTIPTPLPKKKRFWRPGRFRF